MNPKQTLTTSVSGSCIELTWTPPVTVAAVKIKAAHLPRNIEFRVSLSCHTLQKVVNYLDFFRMLISSYLQQDVSMDDG
jgi:hypothetical protein